MMNHRHGQRRRSVWVTLALMAGSRMLSGQGTTAALQGCVPAPDLRPQVAIRKAMDATGLSDSGLRVLHVRSQMVRELRDLTDRSYPPFDASIGAEDIWFDPRSGIERSMLGRQPMWSSYRLTTMGPDMATPAPAGLHGIMQWQRAFNPWAVLNDWSRDSSVTVVGRCRFRDASRVVLRRPSPLGGEQLILSASDMMPVALMRTERSYFMGPESAVYLYRDWDYVDRALFPANTLRIVNGNKDRLRALAGPAQLVVRDSAPAFPTAARPAEMDDTVRVPPEPGWTSAAPDTVRVGSSTFLLVNSSFTSAVALARDTVWIMDAPQGEARAQQDSVWIGRLFPGKHPLVFVAATGIWPHIAGVRFWVASGATVIAHPAVAPLLRAALARRWTAVPDRLERRRALVRIRIDTVRSLQHRAGGDITIFAIDRSESEGVLATVVGSDRFLWASDRVQDVSNPSLYVAELWDATHRAGIAPEWTSGPHFKVIAWSTLDSLMQRR